MLVLKAAANRQLEGQTEVCGKKEMRKGDSAKPFIFNRARLVGTVLKETVFSTSHFPVT